MNVEITITLREGNLSVTYTTTETWRRDQDVVERAALMTQWMLPKLAEGNRT